MGSGLSELAVLGGAIGTAVSVEAGAVYFNPPITSGKFIPNAATFQDGLSPQITSQKMAMHAMHAMHAMQTGNSVAYDYDPYFQVSKVQNPVLLLTQEQNNEA